MNRLFLLQPRLLLLSAVILSTIHFKATAQDKGRISAGSIIVLSAKGLVQAIDQQENLVNGVLTPGAVLAEGYSIKTGFGGEASLLFSNVSLVRIRRCAKRTPPNLPIGV